MLLNNNLEEQMKKRIYQLKELSIYMQRKISQDFGLRKDAADAFGITKNHLDKIIRGDSSPTPEMMQYFNLEKISGYCRK